MKKIIRNLSAILVGITNSVIGSAGGIIAVESLKYDRLSQKKSHATAISIMLPLSAVSIGLYLYKGYAELEKSLVFIVPGILGALLGSKLLSNISNSILNKIFSIFMIYAGVRMILK